MQQYGELGERKLGEGVVVPIITPLMDDESVDSAAMRRVIDYILAGGVHGIFVMGTTGEYARLSEKEWERAVDLAVEAAAGRAPVYAGVSAPGARQALVRARRAKAAGADAIVLSPGFYFPYSQQEIEALYTAAAGCDVPLLAYNIPVFTHSTIEPATFGRLLEAGAVIGIKDSSGDVALIQRYIETAKATTDPLVLVGSESIMHQAFLAGASGSVPSLANLFPALLVAIDDAARRQEWGRVEALCGVVDEINQLNGIGDSPLGVIAWKKLAMEDVGLCSARMTSPAPEYSPEAIARIRGVIARHREWMAPRYGRADEL